MLKIFSTQLMGLLKRLQEQEEYAIEDAARLLAQAAVGEGVIYLYGSKEMEGVVYEAIDGHEPLIGAVNWSDSDSIEQIKESDRFIIITRNSSDAPALKLAENLVTNGVPFIAISTDIDTSEPSLESLADIHIDLRLTKGLVPAEDGTRFGYPTLIAALFVFTGIRFAFNEILAEYTLD